MNLEQSGSAPMVPVFISNSLVGESMTSVRGKPFHQNTATSKENTGVFTLFASYIHCTCNLHYPNRPFYFAWLCRAMIWCDIPLTERPSDVQSARESKDDVTDIHIY